METKEIKTIAQESITEEIQQVLWEKHLQEFPQGPYRCNPIVITVKREGNQKKSVEYKNDI
jgi:hypothetical protein